MRKRKEIMEDYETTSSVKLSLEVLLDIRDLLQEISYKIRKNFDD